MQAGQPDKVPTGWVQLRQLVPSADASWHLDVFGDSSRERSREALQQSDFTSAEEASALQCP